jgi:hypothetical protein
VRVYLKRELGIEPELETHEVKTVEKKVYKRDYAAFNEAQTVEKHRVQEMLRDLVAKLPEPERKEKRGRKPHSVKDTIYAMAIKVYGTQ